MERSTVSKPRILLWDIETRYTVFRGWSTGEQYVKHDQIIDGQHPDIICLSYKWLDEPKVYTLDWGCKQQNSDKMIAAFTKVIESADLVIAHNGDKFDQKHINTQRMLHDQDPISWPTSEDTLKQIRKHFALPSYSLDYLSKLLGRKGKDKMNFADWVAIVEKKDPKALAKMRKYNRNDVLELEAVYKKFFKFLTPKINASIVKHNDKAGCPRCGSGMRQSKGYKVTLAGKYKRWQCMDCGTQYKDRKSLKVW